MISVDEARQKILKDAAPLGVEHVALRHALGRVLAGPVTAARTQPPFAASAMDGYAVRAEDAQAGTTLTVIGEAAAGHAFEGTIAPGQAARIFTGAPVPDGADTIVIQEDTTRDGDRVTVTETAEPGAFVRPAGADFRAGDSLHPQGPLRPQDIALLAAMNQPSLPVRRKPVVALIPTGDELVLPGADPGPDQIISSNNFGLAAMLQAAGATPRLLPIARDTPEALATALDLARGSDLIVTLGGASVGDHDLVQSTALDAGLTLGFYKIAMRPGKPLIFGHLGPAALLGLPGNPVSAMVCGLVFVLPLVRALLGLPTETTTQTGRLSHALGKNGPRAHYMRAVVTAGPEGPRVRIFDRQDSSLLSVLQKANALAIREPGAPPAAEGDEIAYILLDPAAGIG